MFKIIGSVVVLLSATLLGMKKYNDFFERRKVLQGIRDGSVQVENALRCMCLPLDESFICGGQFFKSAAEKISEGMLPGAAVMETSRNICALSLDDLEIIERFATGLCAQDCKGQLANIKLFINELDSKIAHATNELNTRGKLYVKGSILTAAAIVLLLV